jgi:hypothetical protein
MVSMTSRFLGLGLAGVTCIACLAGCPGEQTINQISQHLDIQQVLPGGTYIGYSGTSFSQSIPAGKEVHLLSATISSSSGEFSWASSLVGSASQSEGAQVIVQKSSFEGASSPTDLDVVDTGNLVPLFQSGDTSIRVYWILQFSDSPAQSYPNGVTVTFNYEFEIK